MLHLNRRSAITSGLSGLYLLGAARVPAAGPPPSSRPGRAPRAGQADIDRLHEMIRLFARADDLYGGGHARKAVGGYLVNNVVPLLEGSTGRHRPALFAAASQVAYLAGWMTSDAGRAGLAQWYYIKAVRLAREGGDDLAEARTWRSLAVQACELGHSSRGVVMADHAASLAHGRCDARTCAWITGMRAEAYAAAGDGWTARDLLRRAERDLERADSAAEGDWVGNYRQASLNHQIGTSLAALGDLEQAEQHLAASVGSRQSVERRSRALIGARLAHVQARAGHPDRAAHTIIERHQDLLPVASARVTSTLCDLRAHWACARTHDRIADADQIVVTALARA
ncbi:hypothetical protein [Actinomadura kijaniata]|uniref:hypothetical protein n=1 Tax=Actinomadura kijaniata TaxID=46161 RepID=UPI00082E6FD4|nr:hypothetical protein [Actinomadura kijaniata]